VRDLRQRNPEKLTDPRHRFGRLAACNGFLQRHGGPQNEEGMAWKSPTAPATVSKAEWVRGHYPDRVGRQTDTAPQGAHLRVRRPALQTAFHFANGVLWHVQHQRNSACPRARTR